MKLANSGSAAWVIAALFCMAAQAGEGAGAIYHSDPDHLWNRLYRAIAVRTEGGRQYGIDQSSPFTGQIWFDDPRLIPVLDEFLKGKGETLIADPVARALLLNDSWTAFDIAAQLGDQVELQRRLAAVVGRLTLSRQALEKLPDNYLAAVKSQVFPEDFDPARPGRAFLPRDLFDSKGPWVQIADTSWEVMAPVHVQALSGRSVFKVFIRCPGGREATLAYLTRLNLHLTPWALQPAELGTTSYPQGQVVRMSERRLDPATPQFPAGTTVALVRQMMAIDEKLDPVAIPITQSVQFRVYRKVTAEGTRPRP